MEYKKLNTQLLFAVICITQIVSASLDHKLNYYEIVEDIHIHSREQRSVDIIPSAHCKKNIALTAMGRNFSIHLTKPREHIFSKDFKMKIVHEDGSSTPSYLNVNNFCGGVLDGEDKSQVLAYFDGDGSLASAKISTETDDFLIEPVWRHSTRKEDEKKMLIYKAKDVKWPYDAKKNAHHEFCGAFHPDKEHGFDEIVIDKFHNHYTQDHHRQKRDISSNKMCRLIAVADYKFFQSMGGSQIYGTASYIVNVIDEANKIYTTTNFGQSSPADNGYGFELAELRIHDGPTAVSSGTLHYNMVKSDWQIQQLLDTFSTDIETFQSFCLAHLFTHESFANNVLGLAYIAGPGTSDIGGICSPLASKDGKTVSLNTGWTSTMDQSGGTVLNRQSQLVTSHEFGHNWGSEHDPTSGDCAPGSILGDGKYLMYPSAVTGENSNNDKFSSCSVTFIKNVLTSKAAGCFQAASQETTCGNGRIDSGEQCDGGFLGKFNLDPCCNSDCQLSSGSVCSPANYPCCSTDCQIAGSLLCDGTTTLSCKEPTFCDGSSLTCPTPINKALGTPCIDDGSCRDGECIAFCEFIGQTSCVCDDLANSCRRCCRDPNGDNQCKPYNSTLLLADNRPCVQGVCQSGVCIKTDSSLIERFWNLIDKLSFDFVAETFKTNMVAFIQCFSLILWVPISCCIWCKDKKTSKKRRKDNKVEIRHDRSLIFDEDHRKIVRKQAKLRPDFGRHTYGGLRPMNLKPISHPVLPPVSHRPASAASRTSGSRSRNRVVPLPKKEELHSEK